MSFPSEVLTEMERGDQYLSNLNQQLLNDLKRGCNDCWPNGLKCLTSTMNALNWKNNLPGSVYDATDAINLEIMQKIIGDYSLVIPVIGYWWVSEDGDAPLNQAQILNKTPFNFLNEANMTVAFTGVLYKRLNIAYPLDQPTKNSYVNADDPNDNGSIGGITDLMGASVTTGIFKQHNGNYVVNGNRILIFSTQ